DREADARHAISHPGLGAKAAAEPAVIALVEQVDIHLAQLGTEGIGVLGLLQAAAPVDTQAIGLGLPEFGHKQPRYRLVHPGLQLAALVEQLHFQRPWLPGAYQGYPILLVGSEEGKGIAVLGPDQGLDIPVVTAHPMAHQCRSPSAICIDWSILLGVRPAIQADSWPRKKPHKLLFRC